MKKLIMALVMLGSRISQADLKSALAEAVAQSSNDKAKATVSLQIDNQSVEASWGKGKTSILKGESPTTIDSDTLMSDRMAVAAKPEKMPKADEEEVFDGQQAEIAAEIFNAKKAEVAKVTTEPSPVEAPNRGQK